MEVWLGVQMLRAFLFHSCFHADLAVCPGVMFTHLHIHKADDSTIKGCSVLPELLTPLALIFQSTAYSAL